MDFWGDTLVKPTMKGFEVQGVNIVADQGGTHKIFDTELNEIVTSKGEEVLVDPVSNMTALYFGEKVTVFNVEGDKVQKFKNCIPLVFFSGRLLQEDGTVWKLNSDDSDQLGYQFKRFELIENQWLIIRDFDGVEHVYNSDWTELGPGEPLRRVKYIGEGSFWARSRKFQWLINDECNTSFTSNITRKGDMNHDALVLQDGIEKYFVDRCGKLKFKRKYLDAQSFKGEFTSVKEPDGWAIINDRGQHQTLPSYSTITPVGADLFSVRKQPLYGLFDSHGNEILPVKFQKITVISKSILQCIWEGEIQYYSPKGKRINLD